MLSAVLCSLLRSQDQPYHQALAVTMLNQAVAALVETSVEAPEAEVLSPMARLLLVLDLDLPALVAALLLLGKWTVKSTLTALSVHAVVSVRLAVAPAQLPEGSFGFQLDPYVVIVSSDDDMSNNNTLDA